MIARTTPEDFLPLSPADLQLLLVLMEGACHAYAISKSVEGKERGHVPLEIGSLYRMLARLNEWSLIDDEPAGGPNPDGPPRKVFRITELGREVVRAEAQRLRSVLAVADARLRSAEA